MPRHFTEPAPPERFVTSDPPDIEAADTFRRLVAIMDRLRGPGGCPWDRKQTHDTLKQYMVEEVYEVLDAIDDRDDDAFRGELGDLLLQVVFHAQLAAEEERFTIDDVCRAICEKLIRRHPHIFADVEANDAGAVLRNWEQIKLAERREQNGGATDAAPSSVAAIFEGIPRHLPALQQAARVQEKAARVGFDWPALAPVLDKVVEEIDEWREALAREGIADAPNPHLDPARLPERSAAATTTSAADIEARSGAGTPIEDEFGDLLFAMVNAARFLHLEPEAALKRATAKFMRRYALMERLARDAGADWAGLTLDEMDEYWKRAKAKLDAPLPT